MRPGIAEQLAWGPAGGVRDVGPLGVARTTSHKAGHLTERETKAQTPGKAQTLTLGTRAPKSPLPSPQVQMLPQVPDTLSYLGTNGALPLSLSFYN